MKSKKFDNEVTCERMSQNVSRRIHDQESIREYDDERNEKGHDNRSKDHRRNAK